VFQDLKAALESLEAKVRATFSGVEGKVTSLKTEISTLDRDLEGALDRTEAQIRQAKTGIGSAFNAARGRAKKLLPPGGA
jgi:hypothetical protein